MAASPMCKSAQNDVCVVNFHIARPASPMCKSAQNDVCVVNFHLTRLACFVVFSCIYQVR